MTKGRTSAQSGFHLTGINQRDPTGICLPGRDSGRESVRSCKPRNTRIKSRGGTGNGDRDKESQEHQDKAFWSAPEPFRPDEEVSPDAEQTSDAGNPEGREPEKEGEWSGARAKMVSVPHEPTEQELEEHLLTHWPFRSWCDHCVRGRGKSGQHREVKREASIPIVGIDYMWMTGEDDEGGDESLREMPILALTDQESG